MSFDLKKLVRPHLLNLKPYSSARDEYKGTKGVFLDANENSYGSTTNHGNYSRYPDPMQWAVKSKLSEIKHIAPEHIFLGNGSDEPIDLLFRILCEPGQDSFLQTPPTYGMYQVCADINNVQTINVNLTADFQLQTDEILSAVQPNTKMIFLCSPNNPSGNSLAASEMLKIVENFDGIVVVDEAYIDFSKEESFVKYVAQYPNLVVLQTFSKAWGLANLRIGMAFTSLELIVIMNKVKYPYNINGLTQQLAQEALGNLDKQKDYVSRILQQRDLLEKELSKLGYVQKIYPSDANFLLVKFENANKLFDYLIEHEVITRSRTKVTLCEDCIRITVGTESENKTLLQKIKEFYN
ncbi:MAG: histidinol-phosphate transaminase [Cytophagales bacterium]